MYFNFINLEKVIVKVNDKLYLIVLPMRKEHRIKIKFVSVSILIQE